MVPGPGARVSHGVGRGVSRGAAVEAGGLGSSQKCSWKEGGGQEREGAEGQGSVEDRVFLLGEALGLGWIPTRGPTEKALRGLLHRPQQSAHGLTKSPFIGNSVVTWKNAYPGSFGGEAGSKINEQYDYNLAGIKICTRK